MSKRKRRNALHILFAARWYRGCGYSGFHLENTREAYISNASEYNIKTHISADQYLKPRYNERKHRAFTVLDSLRGYVSGVCCLRGKRRVSRHCLLLLLSVRLRIPIGHSPIRIPQHCRIILSCLLWCDLPNRHAPTFIRTPQCDPPGYYGYGEPHMRFPYPKTCLSRVSGGWSPLAKDDDAVLQVTAYVSRLARSLNKFAGLQLITGGVVS